MATSHNLRYWMLRPNGDMVPVIPADELPTEIRLLGVPQKLTPTNLTGMECLGRLAARSSDTPKFEVESNAPWIPQEGHFMAPDARVRGSEEAFLLSANTPNASSTWRSNRLLLPEQCTPPSALQNAKAQDARSRFIIDKIASSLPEKAQHLGYTSRPLPPSGVKPNPLQKEYCTYWIKTGDCSFVQQGCLYKHEMPPLDKVKEIGINRVPQWWQDKTAVQPETSLRRKVNQAKARDLLNSATVDRPSGILRRDVPPSLSFVHQRSSNVYAVTNADSPTLVGSAEPLLAQPSASVRTPSSLSPPMSGSDSSSVDVKSSASVDEDTDSSDRSEVNEGEDLLDWLHEEPSPPMTITKVLPSMKESPGVKCPGAAHETGQKQQNRILHQPTLGLKSSRYATEEKLQGNGKSGQQLTAVCESSDVTSMAARLAQLEVRLQAPGDSMRRTKNNGARRYGSSSNPSSRPGKANNNTKANTPGEKREAQTINRKVLGHGS